MAGITQFLNVNVQDKLFVRGIEINTGALPARNDLIVVQQKSDFPAPIAGVITLDQDIQYNINGDIDLGTDVIELNGNNVIQGSNPFNDRIRTDSTSPLISGTDSNTQIEDLTLENPSGRIFELEEVSGSNNVCSFDQCILQNMAGIGLVNNLRQFNFRDCRILEPTAEGFLFQGTNMIVDINSNVAIWDTPVTVIELGTATFDYFSVNENYIEFSVFTIFLNGLPDSGNFTPGGQGILFANTSTGAQSLITGVLTKDLNWEWIGNSEIPDTLRIGGMFASDNVLFTTIPAVDTPVKANVATTAIDNIQRFEMTDNNELTYIDNKIINPQITVSITAVVAGGFPVFDFLVYKNGVQIDGGVQTASVSTIALSVTVVCDTFMFQGDILEVWVENKTDATDIVITDMTVSARG